MDVAVERGLGQRLVVPGIRANHSVSSYRLTSSAHWSAYLCKSICLRWPHNSMARGYWQGAIVDQHVLGEIHLSPVWCFVKSSPKAGPPANPPFQTGLGRTPAWHCFRLAAIEDCTSWVREQPVLTAGPASLISPLSVTCHNLTHSPNALHSALASLSHRRSSVVRGWQACMTSAADWRRAGEELQLRRAANFTCEPSSHG